MELEFLDQELVSNKAQMSIPNLTGRVDPVVEATIRDLYQKFNTQASSTTAALTAIPKPLSIGDVLAAIGPGSKNSLNVTGLVGLLSQPQNAKVSNNSTTPTPGTPQAQNGTLFLLNGQLFYYLNGQGVAVESVAVVLYDTHANRLANYPAGNYVAGTLFYETDRQVIYVDTGTVWLYAVGIEYNSLASRPGDLGTNDVGFLFVASDYSDTVSYRWSGTAWLWFQGVYYAVTASRPSGLGTNDAGFQFIDTTLKIFEFWNGSTWVTIGSSKIFSPNFRAFSGSTDTLLITDFTVESTNSGAATETLLDATTCLDQTFCIKNSVTSTNNLSVSPIVGQTIDGGSLILQPQESVIIQSDGSNWVILAYYRLSLTGLVLQGESNGIQLNLTTSYQNVAGAAVTLNRTGTWLVQGVLDYEGASTAGAATGQLLVAGSPFSPTMPVVVGNLTSQVSTQVWVVVAASSSVALQLQAKSNTGPGTAFANNAVGWSSLTATWIHA